MRFQLSFNNWVVYEGGGITQSSLLSHGYVRSVEAPRGGGRRFGWATYRNVYLCIEVCSKKDDGLFFSSSKRTLRIGVVVLLRACVCVFWRVVREEERERLKRKLRVSIRVEWSKSNFASTARATLPSDGHNNSDADALYSRIKEFSRFLLFRRVSKKLSVEFLLLSLPSIFLAPA